MSGCCNARIDDTRSKRCPSRLADTLVSAVLLKQIIKRVAPKPVMSSHPLPRCNLTSSGDAKTTSRGYVVVLPYFFSVESFQSRQVYL